MRIVLLVVACVACCGPFLDGAIADAQKEEAAKAKPDNVIQVQVTGMLCGPPLHLTVVDGKSRPDATYSGSVFAGGRELRLDCAGKKDAKELLEKAYADLRKHTGFIPNKNVQVTGQLQFRPCIRVLYDYKGKQIEHTDTFPVIVVESLKIVE